MTIWIGVDPGKTGAIGILDDGGAHVIDMPPNPHDLAEALALACTGGTPLVCVEQQQAMPKQGVSSTFTLGEGYGAIIGALAALKVPYRLVRPTVWKKDMGLTGHDKEASRALARSLWPDAPLSRKCDHGRAESLLIAEWCRRQEVQHG